ncbi:magnesium transporter CorA family protein [Enterococcus faecalis]
MINYLTMKNQQLVTVNQPSTDVKWIRVEHPSEEEITQLITTYNLPRDYITGALDAQENARFEGLYQNQQEQPLLMLMRYPKASVSPSGYMQLETCPFAIILTNNGQLLTVSDDTADFAKLLLTQTFVSSTISVEQTLFLQLLWEISLSFNLYLKELTKQTAKLEGELQVSTENSQLYQMMDIQKSLVYFESALSANAEVLKRLYRIKLVNDPKEHLPHLHDILVETKQGLTSTQIQLKLVDNISSTFSAIVSNNLNNVMKILTSLTIVLTIPAIIGGVFGMNVKLPFAERADAFWWIFIITVVLCVWAIRSLKKKNLL